MRFRARPIWLVLLLACGPQSGTEVGNPTYACSGSQGDDAASGGGGGYPACDPNGDLTFRCDDAPCDLVDFGEVAVGETGRVTLTIVNGSCTVYSFPPPQLDGAVVLLEGLSSTATLIPGREMPMVLGFRPTAAGPTGGDVRFALTPGGERLLPWIGTGR
jgi:hypothetical protein